MDDFSDFYRASKDRVFRAVLVAGRNPSVAEDAVAEAFARALAGWSRVRAHPNPAAWVILTALNAQRSWWRRTRREVLEPVPERSVAAAEPAGWSTQVRLAIAQLPRRQREVVALRVLADLSQSETADVLGIAANTVGAHLNRALASLRSALPAPPARQDREPDVTPTGRDRPAPGLARKVD